MSARERELGELPSPDLSLLGRKAGQGLIISAGPVSSTPRRETLASTRGPLLCSNSPPRTAGNERLAPASPVDQELSPPFLEFCDVGSPQRVDVLKRFVRLDGFQRLGVE